MIGTIVIRTYNRISHLKECLNSISEQSSDDWEVLIFDDGQQGYDLYKRFKEKHFDKRILYISSLEDFHLFNRAWKYSIMLSEGDIVIRVDDDDLLHPQAVEIITNAYKFNPSLDFTVGSTILFDLDNNLSYSESILPKYLPYQKYEWLPYAFIEGRTSDESRIWKDNFYDTPQPFKSIIHASRFNISIVYGLYTMRVSSVRNVIDTFSTKYRKGEDLEFFGILDHKGLTYSSFKKGLHFTRSSREYERITNDMHPKDTELVRDRADEFRKPFHISSTIDLVGIDDSRDVIDEKYLTFFNNFKKLVESKEL